MSETLWLSRTFANSHDKPQAKLLNEMSKQLRLICKDSVKYENQCCYITEFLDDEAIKFINQLSEFIKLRELPF